MQDQTARQTSWWLISLCLIALLLNPFTAQALTLPPDVEEIRHYEGITEYKLKNNGLTVLLAPDDTNASVTVNMTYLVGARHENYGQTGMAHLLEHMLFKGTPTLKNALGEFSKRGLQANGTTWDDRTNYFASFTANPETLDWYIRWQADVMVNAMILREDLDSEMTVVRNEMEQSENSPSSMLLQKMTSAAYQWHNYGNAVIGARSDVENVDIEQLRDFYRMYYQPDNAVLVVAGKFDVQQTLDVIADAFSPIARPDRVLPREYTIEPVQDGERRVTLRRTGGTPLVATIYHIPQGAHPDFAAVVMATNILADTPSGPLYKALVPTGLATDVFGSASNNKDPHVALFGAMLPDDQEPEKVLNILNTVVADISQKPFTQEDLDRAKQQWLNGWNQLYSDISRVGVRLTEYIAKGDWRLFFQQRDAVKAVSLEQVQSAAEKYFVPSNRTEGLYIPTDKPVRAPAFEPQDLSALLKDYESESMDAISQAFDTSTANLDAQTQRKLLNLPSGTIKLALLPKPTRGDRVTALISVQFGDAETLKGKAAVSVLTAETLAYGTQQLSRQAISDHLDKLDSQIAVSGRGTTVEMQISSRKDTLKEALELAVEMLKTPSFEQDQFDEVSKRLVTYIQKSMSEPEAIAQNALDRYENPWPKDDLRYAPTFEESLDRIQQVSRDDLVDFHTQFYGNGEISVSVVGEFEPEVVENVLQTQLSDWKRAPKYTRLSDPYEAVKPHQFILETPDKANAFYLARLPIALQDTDPHYPALVMANFLLGQSHSSRLWTRIRDIEGLSYGVGSAVRASAFEPSAVWSLYAIYAPENLAKLRVALNEELERAQREGFTEEELETGKVGLLNLRALSRTRDATLASIWQSYLETNRTFAFAQAFDDRLQTLTLDEVNDALRQYLKAEDLVQAFAGDFAKSQTKSTTP
ncbi:M16 family metallopeptidase [Orrella sp. 11846]|uniref:M16 family metallopeptidase n=1 Tax=Orrella sp. 11846 TaxID=3409913 RepID=UPI003B5A23AA